MSDFGKLILRLTLGGLMGLHGYHKLMNFEGTNTFIMKLLTDNGLPQQLVYGVYVTEVLAPLLIIIGFWTRLSALAFAGGMVMAVYLAHLPEVTDPSKMFTQHGGLAIELQALYTLCALALAFIGPGRIALQPEGGSASDD